MRCRCEARTRYAGRVLTVVSWNVLASAYVKPEWYPHTAPELLDPVSREARVVEHVVGLRAADAICLQEIEPATFAAIVARLDAFEGCLVQKRGKPDGCAIFVRRAMGAAVFRELVYGDGTGHVAAAAVVGGVGIATTHLKWQAADVPIDVRLGRAELTELLDAWVAPGEPWVVCGDLERRRELASARGRVRARACATATRACPRRGRATRTSIGSASTSSCTRAGFEATPKALPPITDVTPLPSATEPSDHVAIQVALKVK